MTTPESQNKPPWSRRHFIQKSVVAGAAANGALSLARSAHAAAVGGAITPGLPVAVAGSSASTLAGSLAPAVLTDDTAADHRRRLQNIATCNRNIRKCLRKQLIGNYLPGQCSYNLGEYPCLQPWNPDEWDEQELDRLRDHGIGLIQVHEEWNDSQRLWGSHKLAPLNPAGFRRFVEMVHRRGMRLIVYVSSGFFERHDPDFRKEWAQSDLVEIYYHYARCSPASPGWRAYFLPRLVRILDEYGIDGIYNDLGYVQPMKGPDANSCDDVFAFEETATCDGALGDLLGMVYSEVNRRGGIVKIHQGNRSCPRTDIKIYDYLWVGEGVEDVNQLRVAAKDYPPHVVPCLDMSRAKIDKEEDLYLHSIPYMQFPLLLAGRPFTGQRAAIPGVQYQPEEKCFWTRHCRAIWKHYQAHPEGPHSYGWWDSSPGRPEAQPTHAKWLKQYRPIVEDGSWAWLEIGDSDFFRQPLPEKVVASAFANRELYLVLANYNERSVEMETADTYKSLADPVSPPSKRWTLPGRSLHILQRLAE